jgi:plastocyanin
MMIRLPILLMATCALALVSCGGSATASRPAGSATEVHISDFKITPAVITRSGSSVTFAVHNDGPTVHNLTVRDSSGKVVASTKTLKPGGSETTSVQLAPGTYTTFCSLPGHESLGMRGTLVVTE